jgi:hypothetical protein
VEPWTKHEQLAENYRKLRVLESSHRQSVKGFLEASERFYPLDFFLVGVAERSLHLTKGFLTLFGNWNIVAAAPLVRLQIDNLTKVCYEPSIRNQIPSL